MYLITFGGLNDTINQIMHAYNYCKKNNRILVINTLKSRLESEIQNYFFMKDPIIYQNSLSDFQSLSKNFDRFPNLDLSSLKLDFESDTKNTTYNDKFYNINLEKKYSERIICYGNKKHTGLKTKDFFLLFEMKQNITCLLNKRYNFLPKNYISVHIRNTDYKSDVPKFVTKYEHIFKHKNIFLACDNKLSRDYFIKHIDANIFTFTELPEYNQQTAHGIHKFKTSKKVKINIESIIDLILLSLGEKIYASCEHSGFSKNAIRMQQDEKFKQIILQRINNMQS